MSVAGQARHIPGGMELLYKTRIETNILHALIRDQGTKPGTVSSRPIGSVDFSPTLTNTNVFTEPIALHPKVFIISSDEADTLRIDKNFGEFASRVIVTGQGGIGDNIEFIIGKDDGEGNVGKAAFAGQILNIEAVLTTPLTLIEGTDLTLPGGVNFTIKGGSNATLIYDSTLDKWKFLHEAMVQSLNDILDVVITVPITGEHLEFDGTNWINTPNLVFPATSGGDILNIEDMLWLGGHQLARSCTPPHLDLVMSGDTTFRITVNSATFAEWSDLGDPGLKMSKDIYMQNNILYFDSPSGTRRILFDGTSSLDYKIPAANFHRFFAGASQRFGVSDAQISILTVPINIAEITIPSNPAANSGRFYAKDVGGTHAEPFWLDELGTETNLLGGGGGDNISEGNSKVEVIDLGTGRIDFFIDSASPTLRYEIQGGTQTLFPVNDNDVDLGLFDKRFKNVLIDELDIQDDVTNNPSGGRSQITADPGGMNFGVAAADDRFEFWNGGVAQFAILEDGELNFLASGKLHKIIPQPSSLDIVAELESNSVKLITGTGRTNENVQVNDLNVIFKTETTDTQPFELLMRYSNPTTSGQPAIGNIGAEAEDSANVFSAYAAVVTAIENDLSTSRDGRMQLVVAQNNSAASRGMGQLSGIGFDIQGGAALKIAFFGVTPVTRRSPSATSAAIITALEQLGLFV